MGKGPARLRCCCAMRALRREAGAVVRGAARTADGSVALLLLGRSMLLPLQRRAFLQACMQFLKTPP
jgi:hypothetical protein